MLSLTRKDGICRSKTSRERWQYVEGDMDLQNQIIGVMRFSYPAKEGFSASKMEEQALLAYLYAPERMARRFEMLETLALPSLAAQSDMNFTLVIQCGETLLEPYQARLAGLAERYPFVHPIYLPRLGGFGAAKRSLRRVAVTSATHVTGFRLDDDDAVAVDYIARTRTLAGRLIRAGLAEGPTALAFAKGIYWDMNAPQAPFHEYREPQPLGLASAMITSAALETNIYRYNHRRLACFVPTYMEPDGYMFLRTLHGHNDSRRSIPPHAKAIVLEEARQLLVGRFAIDVDAALALMPESPRP
jgi:hypothetical protein